MEKKPLSIQVSSSGTEGDITPTSPSSHDASMDEADKKLEAMGYTPVPSPFRTFPTSTAEN
jgi:hypothetical protein